MTTAAPDVTVVGGVPRSGEQIQAALAAFVGRWKSYQGTEKAEAQTFLNQLFACYGTDRNAVGAKLEDFTSSAGFTKLHRVLDESVAACYGWPKSVAQNDAEIVRRLTALNTEITQGRRTYNPFGTAGDAT